MFDSACFAVLPRTEALRVYSHTDCARRNDDMQQVLAVGHFWKLLSVIMYGLSWSRVGCCDITYAENAGAHLVELS
jgi:hypothetical protein